MRFYAALWLDYLKNYFKTRMTYRSDFWVEIVSDLMFLGMNLFFVLVVFGHVDRLGGWTLDQMIFIYGYFMVPYGIFQCFFNLWNFSERYIVKGEMDRVLTRPVNNLYQLLLENMDPASLFSALAGLLIMAYAWPRLGVELAWHDPLVLLLLAAGSVLIYGGVYIALTSLSFYTDAPTGILPLVWNIQNYGRYPVTIYNRAIRWLLTFFLPFAFVGFYPAAYFLDRDDWGTVALMTPVVGLVFLAVGLFCWNRGVSKYRGAGS
ncbi:ABC transporter permease [Paenibacillus thermoaerophilus]|uniref:ABC transporter permease n=1 Tax=Paenibacillus thermoaerophilus TaxID=1215385 RepID=A0ABW2V1Y2_9BACL|nr:ABC-2 family transporter protein [Paenibacillus thermoaerophilus]TMV13930.1 ABC transporter permease [Paenibacillus thermoaerophilus]